MRETIKQILDQYGETIQYNTSVTPEDAQALATDALLSLIKNHQA
jgi:hypothetical protein